MCIEETSITFQKCNLYFVYPRNTKELKRTRSWYVRAFQIELEFGNVGFWGEGKTGVPGEKPLGAEKRTNCYGRRVLSPLRHPCSPPASSERWSINWFSLVEITLSFLFGLEWSILRRIRAQTMYNSPLCHPCSPPASSERWSINWFSLVEITLSFLFGLEWSILRRIRAQTMYN